MQALAVFEEGAALVRERDAARGAHQQLHAQPLLQRIEAATHDGGGHALRARGRRQAALGGNRDEGFELLELVHAAPIMRAGVTNAARTALIATAKRASAG